MDSERIKKRDVLSSPRLSQLKKKKKKYFRNKVIIILFIFMILIVGLSLASHIKKINIDSIEISGNKIIDTVDLKDLIQSDLNGHYFGFFSKTNFLIYPKNKIKNDLITKFKRIKDISIDINNFRTLNISITEREGKYLWCGNDLPIADNNSILNCYFLDSQGYIFDQAPYFSGEIYFKFYGTDNSIKNDPAGVYFLPEYFEKIISLKENIEKMGLKPTIFYLENSEDADIYLSSPNTLIERPKVTFKLNSDYEKLAENLEAAIKTEPLKSNLKNKYSSLQYIDLRFGNKVYYKFK